METGQTNECIIMIKDECIDNVGLNEREQTLLSEIEQRIQTRIDDLVREVYEVNYHHLFREDYRGLREYCLLKWGIDGDFVIKQMRKLRVKEVLDAIDKRDRVLVKNVADLKL